MSKPLTKRYPYLDEYFTTVAWKDLLKKLGERRPLIFIMVNNLNRVTEVLVKEESEMEFVERLGRFKHTDRLTQRLSTKLTPPLLKAKVKVAPKEADPKPVAAPVVEDEILKEAISTVAVQRGNEGEAVPGRWVEFLAGKEVKQGKIVEVSDDELFFTISTRDGQTLQVDADALQSLIPEVI